jgi:hypothetical protein
VIVQRIGPSVQFVVDIATIEGRAAVFAVRRDFDIVVSNAGGPPPGDFRDWDRDACQNVLADGGAYPGSF